MLNFFEPIEPIDPIATMPTVTSIEPIDRMHTDIETGVDLGAMTSWKNELLPSWSMDAMRTFGIEMRMGDMMARSEDCVGTPNAYRDLHDLQDLPYNCSVAVQYCILRAFGVDVSEAEVTELAMEKGWLTHNGATIEDVGKVLEHYGIDIHCRENATFANLIVELERGHSVIIVVDAGELWAESFGEHAQEWLEDIADRPDHVVWLTGIDLSDPNEPYVIINDTGHPDGAGARYSLSEFKDAWEDGRYTYIATDEAPADYEAYLAEETGLPNA